MTKRNSIIIVALVAVAAVAIAAYDSYPALAPAVLPPSGDIAQDINEHNAPAPGVNDTNFPLTVPDGFKIEAFATGLTGARVIVKDGLGNYLVSQPSLGQVSMIEMTDGKPSRITPLLRGLNRPHGLAIDPHAKTILYVAEENRISRVSLYSEDKLTKVADLPSGGEHTSRTIAFGPDDKLYVAIGSTCNVCRESDPMRAAIHTWTKQDGLQPFASGLRNTVFFVWDASGRMWGNDMGRDLLGDNLPPDELNVLEAGKDYGWPICYGKNIHDIQFDKNVYVRDPCADKTAPAFEYPAHSAPLGIAFAPTSWPAPYGGATIVAFHGSWNRSVPTGYKLVALTRNGKGGFDGMQDFISGWLKNGKALGRPVDVITDGNDLFVTDDKAGLVYKITYVGK